MILHTFIIGLCEGLIISLDKEDQESQKHLSLHVSHYKN